MKSVTRALNLHTLMRSRRRSAEAAMRRPTTPPSEQALHDSEDLLRLAIESAQIGIWDRDLVSGEVRWSQKCRELLGVHEDMPNPRFASFINRVHPEDRKRLSVELDAALHPNSTGKFICVYRLCPTATSEAHWIVSKGQAFFNDRREPVRIIGTATDITEQKATEARQSQIAAELKLAKEAAEAANHTKSAFLANMSHEIRTPLGAVLGFSELISNPRATAAAKAQYLAAIKRNGELLSNIINDILDLSKVEAGKLRTERRSVMLADVLTDLTTILELKAKEKGILLMIGAATPLPQAIYTDSLRLRQVLLNVAGNAVKFTDKGIVLVTLEMRAGPSLAFVVRDSGIGMNPESTGKLFQPFSQADSSLKRRFGGTGLGLALAKRLAQLLGGDVELTATAPGEGSTFTITISVGDLSDIPMVSFPELAKTAPPLTTEGREPVSLAGLRILVVEDAQDNRFLISRYLCDAGTKVDLACNGAEALGKVNRSDYDAVVMDLQMPVMDGYEATAELRRRGFHRPIIALTAHALKDEREQCLKRGFNEHLSKPVDRYGLISQIAKLTSTP